MGIREEIKAYIVRSGMTMTEVVDRVVRRLRLEPQRSQSIRQVASGLPAIPRSRGACGCDGL